MPFPLLVVAALALGTPSTKEKPPQPTAPVARQERHHSSTVTEATVLGEWQVTHPKWKGTITLRSDGHFSRSHGDAGKWQLKTDGNQTVLELDWKAWAAETAVMVTPDHFRGKVRGGDFEMRRGGSTNTVTETSPAPAKEFANPELKRALSDSVWEMKDGKQFTLHADGTTTGSWHERKGYWRIVGPKTIELKIWWKPRSPEQLIVEDDAKILRWSNEAFGGIAKRVQDAADVRETR